MRVVNGSVAMSGMVDILVQSTQRYRFLSAPLHPPSAVLMNRKSETNNQSALITVGGMPELADECSIRKSGEWVT